MTNRQKLAKLLPGPIKTILRPLKNRLLPFPDKGDSELSFWKSRHAADRGHFKNDHYQRLMLAMAEEPDDTFVNGKVVADFGCGPRGSLFWARTAAWRIGIDVLADVYADEFTDDIVSHEMVYLKSTEKVIPLPSDCVDIMITMNAMDHVENFPEMCNEVVRVIKPGGSFIGSFHLGELPTPCEPQQLTEEIIRSSLLDQLTVTSYRVARKGPPEDVYGAMLNGSLGYEKGQIGMLWVRAQRGS